MTIEEFADDMRDIKAAQNLGERLSKAPDNVQEREKFVNGYQISVIRNSWSYGGIGRGNLFEIAIISPTGEIDYNTGIAGDVVGHLTTEQVVDYAKRIASL